MKLERHEKSEEVIVRRAVSFSAETEEFDVAFAAVEEGGYAEVSIASRRSAGRLPLLLFHPRQVAQLEAMAEKLPALLRDLAAALRAEGYEDLRSESERRLESLEANFWGRASNAPK